MNYDNVNSVGYAVMGGIAAVYILWFFYLAIMNLKRAKDSQLMTKFAYIAALPMLIGGYILDIAVNVTIGSILFLEFPHYKRLTLSARMSYHFCDGGDKWRTRLACWFAKNLLDPYDPTGSHLN
jgi:hypothetical protein